MYIIDLMYKEEKSRKKKDTATAHHPAKLKFLGTALLLLLSLSAGYVGGYFGANRNVAGNELSSSQKILESESQLITQTVKDVGPSVVSVSVANKSVSSGFFGPESMTEESAGTGFIISDDGVVVTNRHVVPANTTRVSITLSDGTELDNVEVIGRTRSGDPLDVAFLKINDTKGKKLSPIRLGDSSSVIVGERVIAIGNALGQFQNSVTSGIISGYGRNIEAGGGFGGAETLQNLFQTDAAVNQGNSGGPLVNIRGEVIGVNTAVAGGGAENIGFAIPINDIKGLIESVLKTGKLQRPYLGVRYVAITDDLAAENNLNQKRGAYVVSSSPGEPAILPDSPADKAGLKEKDIITKVNDEQLDERNSLISLLSKRSVGDKVILTVIRENKTLQLEATLEALPEQ